MTAPTALIAEDEALLAAHLQVELARLWPELQVVAVVTHGEAAVERALALRPDIVFLDIRMPGMTGLEAAQAIGEDWPDGALPPLPVFVTAYDQYALQAFDQAAVDYVLMPVQRERLAQTCARLRASLAQRAAPAAVEAALAQLRTLLGAPGLATGTAPAERHPGWRRFGHPHGADRRGPVLRGGRQIRARDHRRSGAPDPHFLVRVAAAARSGPVLAGTPRHGRALGRRRDGAT
jgi:CheY-like chemotaxis protein